MPKELISINNVSVGFSNSDNNIFANSRDIAKVFGKEHKTMLRSINNLKLDLIKLNKFTEHEIVPSTYISSQGKLLPCYDINRRIFTLIVMGFTGLEALKWKCEYSDAFDLMENMLTDKIAIEHTEAEVKEKERLRNELLAVISETVQLKADLKVAKTTAGTVYKHGHMCVNTINKVYDFGCSSDKARSILETNGILEKYIKPTTCWRVATGIPESIASTVIFDSPAINPDIALHIVKDALAKEAEDTRIQEAGIKALQAGDIDAALKLIQTRRV